MSKLVMFVLLGCAFLTGFAQNNQALSTDTTYIAPETASSINAKPLVYGAHRMVITNNPWASKIADKILDQGGTATDAAIAAALVLGLTEPQSSGLGGGGYALTYQAKNKQLLAFDGRETAPQSAKSGMFLDTQGQPLPFQIARLSPAAVGIPSEIALLHHLHLRQGKLPWAALVQPAIDLAKRGFPMSPRLHQLLTKNQAYLKDIPALRSIYFNKQGQLKPVNAEIVNLTYAQTLQAVAANPKNFYNGKIAQDIINAVNQAAKKPLLQLSDFRSYQILEAPALCHPFRQWTLCTTPFGSGGVSTLELLAIYAKHPPMQKNNTADWAYRFLEASKLSFADRYQYLADPSQMQIDPKALLEDRYLNQRAQLISDRALKTPVAAGRPRGSRASHAPDRRNRLHGTSSLVIVDAAGNGISMTLSIEHEFGCELFVDGFFLNNELTDFSFVAYDKSNHLIANRIIANSRPRSAISPIMAFDTTGQLTLLSDSPGGAAIICYVAKNIINLFDFKFDPQRAAASGNLCAMNNDPLLEQNSDLEDIIPTLRERGEQSHSIPLVSGLVTILKSPTQRGWIGAADPRREGEALGN